MYSHELYQKVRFRLAHTTAMATNATAPTSHGACHKRPASPMAPTIEPKRQEVKQEPVASDTASAATGETSALASATSSSTNNMSTEQIMQLIQGLQQTMMARQAAVKHEPPGSTDQAQDVPEAQPQDTPAVQPLSAASTHATTTPATATEMPAPPCTDAKTETTINHDGHIDTTVKDHQPPVDWKPNCDAPSTSIEHQLKTGGGNCGNVPLPDGISEPVFNSRAERAKAWGQYTRSLVASTCNAQGTEQRGSRTSKCPTPIAAKLTTLSAKQYYFAVWMKHRDEKDPWAKIEIFERSYLEKVAGSQLTEAWLTEGQMLDIWKDPDVVAAMQQWCKDQTEGSLK